MSRLGLLVAALCALPHGAVAEAFGFMVITAPREGRVSYVVLPDGQSYEGMKPITLINTGLQHPQGIAVDQKRKRLFIADPDVQKIYGYQLTVSGKTLSTDGRQSVVSRQCESRWVAVDSVGNVFFSDEPGNLIMKVSADRVLRNDPKPEVVYSGNGANSLPQVSKPGGIAVDNFHVYWTNKHFGTQAGVLIKGSETPDGPSSPDAISVLASNTVKSYGVCLALGNVYYTDSDHFLWGVKKNGGPIEEVSRSLTNPRGCAYDGDGTVYVADRGANAVYAFAGNMKTISRATLVKAFDYEDAFGLAVISAASRLRCVLSGLSVVVVALASAEFLVQ